MDESALAQRAVELVEAAAPILPRHAPKTRISECRQRISETEIRLAIAFAPQGEHRVRSCLDAAANPAREVYAQERELRIGHRVDQPAHQLMASRVMAFRSDLVILAPKRHDDRIRPRPGKPGDTVAVKAGAVDDGARRERSLSGLNDHLAAATRQIQNPSSCADFPAPLCDELRVFLRHGNVVGDAGDRHVERANAGAVRLDLPQPFRADHREIRNAIGCAAPLEFFERGQFLFARGDHHLPAKLVREAMLPAEGHHRRGALDAGPGLERAGLVVNAGMDHAAVVAGLVRGDAVLFLQDQDSLAGESPRGFQGARQADDSATDDYDVKGCRGHRAAVVKPAAVGLWFRAGTGRP